MKGLQHFPGFPKRMGWIGLGILLLSVLLTSCGSQRKTPPTAPAQALDASLRHQVVDLARQQKGASYRYGATGPRSFDCSGFTYFVFSENGIAVPRRSTDQSKAGKKISLDRARPGDLIVFSKGRKVQHVGICTDNRDGQLRVVHASTSKGVIEENVLESNYWNSRLRMARRIIH